MSESKMVKKGDIVELLPEYQDEGDDQFVWIALNDEEKGRVDICPMGTGLKIPPVYVVRTSWLSESKRDQD